MTVTVRGQSLPLEHDYAEDTGASWQWSKQAPDCPACGNPLTAFNDDTRQASVASRWGQEFYVHCDACGHQVQVAS